MIKSKSHIHQSLNQNVEELNKLTETWLRSLYNSLQDGQRDWVGVYWKEGFLFPDKSESTDLIVGPYIGPETPHKRIPVSEGLCGLAAREGRTINIDDVNSDPRFLACSVTTKSEIVIPICSPTGEVIGELDIDSNLHASFNSQTQSFLEEQVRIFSKSLFA